MPNSGATSAKNIGCSRCSHSPQTPSYCTVARFDELYMVMEICDSDLKKLCRTDLGGGPLARGVPWGILEWLVALRNSKTSEEDEVTTHVCSAVDSETCQLVNISATESRDHLRKKVFTIFAAGCDPDPFAHQYLAVQPASGPEISPLSPDLRQYGNASMTSAAWEWGPMGTWGPGWYLPS